MIAIGCDHAAVELKNEIVNFLKEKNIEVTDCGIKAGEKCDYPDMAEKVCGMITSGKAEKGILVCGTGIGMSIAANKIKGIRAACCSEHFSARYTRLHNDANILCMGGRVVGAGLAIKIMDTFLDTPFSNEERHIRRISKIED